MVWKHLRTSNSYIDYALGRATAIVATKIKGICFLAQEYTIVSGGVITFAYKLNL